jgi:hypothetical protein
LPSGNWLVKISCLELGSEMPSPLFYGTGIYPLDFLNYVSYEKAPF